VREAKGRSNVAALTIRHTEAAVIYFIQGIEDSRSDDGHNDS
jgi:hypothetical protein